VLFFGTGGSVAIIRDWHGVLLQPRVPESWIVTVGRDAGLGLDRHHEVQTQLEFLLFNLACHHLDQEGDGLETLTRRQLKDKLQILRKQAHLRELPVVSEALRTELGYLERRRCRFERSGSILPPSNATVGALQKILDDNAACSARVAQAVKDRGQFVALLTDLVSFLRASPLTTRESYAARSAFDIKKRILFHFCFGFWTRVAGRLPAVTKDAVAFTDTVLGVIGEPMSEAAIRQALNAERLDQASR